MCSVSSRLDVDKLDSVNRTIIYAIDSKNFCVCFVLKMFELSIVVLTFISIVLSPSLSLFKQYLEVLFYYLCN